MWFDDRAVYLGSTFNFHENLCDSARCAKIKNGKILLRRSYSWREYNISANNLIYMFKKLGYEKFKRCSIEREINRLIGREFTEVWNSVGIKDVGKLVIGRLNDTRRIQNPKKINTSSNSHAGEFMFDILDFDDTLDFDNLPNVDDLINPHGPADDFEFDDE